MNVKTNIYYYLSYMYRYINDIYIIRSNKQLNDYKEFAVSYVHSINMCLLQIGEYASKIRRIQTDNNVLIIDEASIPLNILIGLRNRIAHSYDTIESKIIESSINNDLPKVKKYIECNIEKKILNNPQLLLENEYDDIV